MYWAGTLKEGSGHPKLWIEIFQLHNRKHDILWWSLCSRVSEISVREKNEKVTAVAFAGAAIIMQFIRRRSMPRVATKYSPYNVRCSYFLQKNSVSTLSAVRDLLTSAYPCNLMHNRQSRCFNAQRQLPSVRRHSQSLVIVFVLSRLFDYRYSSVCARCLGDQASPVGSECCRCSSTHAQDSTLRSSAFICCQSLSESS